MTSAVDLFVIDPPWPKRKGGIRAVRPKQTRELDYRTMPVSDISVLLGREIFPLAAPIHTVFLWTVDQFLLDAEQVMKTHGYRLHARLIWDKGNGVTPAFTVRYSHEYLLWFYKPKLTPVAPAMRGRVSTVFRGKQRQHSRKPDEAYTILNDLFPDAVKMDVFSREPRAGWRQFGDQPHHFTNDGDDE